jgi:hypothetical protein
MTNGKLSPKNGGPTIDVSFDMRFDTSTKSHPIPGIPVGKSDFFLNIQSKSGTPIRDGDYDLRPDESRFVFSVSKTQDGWVIKTVTF